VGLTSRNLKNWKENIQREEKMKRATAQHPVRCL